MPSQKLQVVEPNIIICLRRQDMKGWSEMIKWFSKNRGLRLATIILSVVALYGAASFSLMAETSLKVAFIELPGTDGINNTLFVFDRYAIVTPFAPSTDPDEEAPLSDYDNHFIHLIDTKKPDQKLSADLQNCYYPTKVIYDRNNANVFVRGTQYTASEEGEYEPTDVISQLLLNLDDNGKPIFGSTVITIRIPGIDSIYSSEAPNELATARKGQFLVFSNGASIFTYHVVRGYLNEVSVVPFANYGPNERISFFDVDEKSNTLVVAVNKREEIEKDVWNYSSTIRFYRVDEEGTVTLFKELNEYSFPQGISLAAGSNVAISSADGDGSPEYGYFITNDGSLYQADLRGKEFFATIRELEKFPDLVQTDPETASPRIVEYDSVKKLITVVRTGGFVINIRRPINARPGRGGIRRPINVRETTELPALVVARLNKKSSKLTSSKVYKEGFEEAGGLSNFILDQDRGFIATFTGNLYSVGLPEDLTQSRMEVMGEIGTRVDQIEYSSARSTLAAINSLVLDEETLERTAPGSLVVARIQTGNNQSSSLMQMFTLNKTFLAGVIPSIRRPCNLRR